MTTYVFRYDSGTGALWERDFTLPSDETARAEGELLLENQAVITPVTGQAISVFRAADGRTRELVGTWIWSRDGAEWTGGVSTGTLADGVTPAAASPSA